MKFLKSKQAREIIKLVEKQWGAKLDWLAKYYFLKNNKGKIFIVNKEINKIKLENLRVDKLGLYVAEVKKEIRLSIEGSQLIGPLAKKNTVELSEKEMICWMKGENIKLNKSQTSLAGYVILKCRQDYLGTGKYKEKVILNHVPKARRIIQEYKE